MSYLEHRFKYLRNTLVIIFSLLSLLPLNAQDISEILNSYETPFEEIIQKADEYFKTKHPNKSAKQLTQGEFRDGAFVKYQRWKSYWEFYKMPNGKLKSISDFYIKEAKSTSAPLKNNNPYTSIQWQNVSNDLDLGTQIGLGRTTSMGFHPSNPDIFYVGAAHGGIWKTTNGGQSYIPLGDQLPLLSVSSIVVDKNNPNTLYIAISDHVWYGSNSIGIYVSNDDGISWSPTAYTTSITSGEQIFKILAHPTNPNTMFIATSSGLYRTDDGFVSYSQINNYSTSDITFHPIDTDILYQLGRNGEFLKSTDAGSNFNLVTDFNNSTFNRLATTLDNPSVVYALCGTQIQKSNDNGTTFSAGSNSLENSGILAIDPNNENNILSGYFNTQLSENGGSSFSEITHWLGNNGLPLIHVDQRNVFNHPLNPDEVLINNDGGLYRYTWSDGLFENLSNGLIITQYYDIAVSQSNSMIISGGSQDNGSMFRKNDGTWEEFAGTGDGMVTEIDPTNASRRYWEYQNGSLRRWNNGSNTNISPPGEDGNGAWETPFKLDPNNSDRIVVGYQKVYASDDKGDNWTTISDNLHSQNNLKQIAIAPSNSDRIYATMDEILYVKNITGNTWTQKSTPLNENITDLEVDPQDMNIVYITYPGYFNGNKVYKSFDAGDTWQNISGSLPNVPVGAIETYNDIEGAVFIGTDAGVFYRDNMMSDWLEYGTFVHTNIRDIEIQYSSQKLRVGTHGRGVYEADIDIQQCTASSSDNDNDGICDLFDTCPDLNDNLIGTPCDDGYTETSGEVYTADCGCGGGTINTQYCSAEGAVGTGGDWISSVQLNTIQVSSGQSNYSNFTNNQTNLLPGQSYTISVNLNYSFGPDEIYAWIDYNQDAIFDNNTELIDFPDISNHSSTMTFTVPSDAEIGITTMRVRVIYASPNNPEPCGSIFGEVEDYGIIIDCNAPGCTDPTACNYNSTAICDDNSCIYNCINPGNLSLKVFLEGAYNSNTGLMHTQLLEREMIPLNQPYNTAPYNYGGLESVPSINDFPNNTVDWVLVELRTGTPSLTGSKTTTLIETVAGLLLNDGSIVDVDGVYPLTFDQVSNIEDYHILVRHRNHLDILSNNTVTGATNMIYDFTTNVNTAFGPMQLKQSGSAYVMHAGDYANDGVIQNSDFSVWITNPAALDVYCTEDGNLDGSTQTTDYDLWFPNRSILGPIEITLP